VALAGRDDAQAPAPEPAVPGQGAPGGKRLLHGGKIVVPERPGVGPAHPGPQPLQRAGLVERPDRPGQVTGVAGSAQDPVDPVLHRVRDRARTGRDDRDTELERHQRVLGGGGRPVGQDQGVGRREGLRDLGGGHVSPGHRHPVLQPEAGDQPQQLLPAVPDLPGHGQRYLRPGLGERPQQDVEPFVGAHDPEEQQPVMWAWRLRQGGPGGCGQGAGGGRPSGSGRSGGPSGSGRPGGPSGSEGDAGRSEAAVRQMRWQGRDLHRGGTEHLRQRRLLGGVDDHRVHPPQQRPHQRLIGAAAFVRQHVVAQRDHRAAARPGRPRQGQVGRRLHRRDDGQYHHVAALAAQPAAGPPPAVRPVPGQRPLHAWVELRLRLGDGQLAGVEQLRVLRPPGHQHGVVAGCGQPVGQGGGVLSDPALVRMGGANDRDSHVLGVPS
jgi:hypothetical protein